MNEKKIKLKTGEIWQERLVAGNGHSGVICSCEPYEEVLTYQNIELLMPTEEPRMTPPEVGSELQEARQADMCRQPAPDIPHQDCADCGQGNGIPAGAEPIRWMPM